MKTPALRLAAVLALFACSGMARLTAATITLDADDLLGTIFPGTPASETNSTEQVRFLVNAYNLGTADGTVLGNNPADPQPEVYTLYRPDGAPSTFAAPVSAGKVDTSNPVVDLNGWTYQFILFFQASNAWVYYIGDIAGSNSINWGGNPLGPKTGSLDGSQISHYVLFNGVQPPPPPPPPPAVPDGGTTVLLVGLGLLVTVLTSRRKKSA